MNTPPMAGTPGFASPEQFLGSYEIDSSSDFYSFGRLLVFMAFEWESAFTLLYNPILDEHFISSNMKLSKMRTILTPFIEPRPAHRDVCAISIN